MTHIESNSAISLRKICCKPVASISGWRLMRPKGAMRPIAGEMLPAKIVQIFNQDTQERINCLPATLKAERILRREMGLSVSAECRAVRNAESDGFVRVVRD